MAESKKGLSLVKVSRNSLKYESGHLNTDPNLYVKYQNPSLKVGSCPINENFFQIFFILFCVAFKYFYFLNLFLPRKPQDFAENSRVFVC